MGLLDKLLFWRKDDIPEFGVDGCFTLPGAEIGVEAVAPEGQPGAGQSGDGDACEEPAVDDVDRSGSSW